LELAYAKNPYNLTIIDSFTRFRNEFDDMAATWAASRTVDLIAVAGHLTAEAFRLRQAGDVNEPRKKAPPLSIEEIRKGQDTYRVLLRVSEFLEGWVKREVRADSIAAYIEQWAMRS
jgi:hypothetical protein